MTKYFNIKSVYGTETIDEISTEDFKTFKEFRKDLKSLIYDYHLSGQHVYISSRCTKDWKNK